jgi:hypothetical protein
VKVSREVAAFAAGIHAAGTRNFHVIAATISGLGLGTYTPAAIQVAVDDWIGGITRSYDEAVNAMPEACDRTRPGTPS